MNFGFGGFCAYCCSEGGVDCVTVLCGHGVVWSAGLWFVLRPDCLMATVVLCGLVCRGVLGVCNLWNFLICRFACCVLIAWIGCLLLCVCGWRRGSCC